VRTAFIIKAITVMMEAVPTSETSVCSNETTRGYIPEDSRLFSMMFFINNKLEAKYYFL
jgi:hypothetical protein